MTFSAKEIASMINGVVEGDDTRRVATFSKIEEATVDSLCFFANEKYAAYLADTPAAIILVSNSFKHQVPSTTTLIRCENPYEATAKLLQFYQSKISNRGVEEFAKIADGVQLSDTVYVGSFSYISQGATIGKETKIFPHVFIGKNVKIGEGVTIYAGVKIYDDCIIGNRCVLHSGVVIGSDGFGFAPTADGSFSKIPQVGNVILEDDVEIGANTVVDRATMGSTRIQQGSKLDNLIQIAHNVVVGKNTVIAAQTGISGSTKVGDNVMIGGQVGIVGHINIGNKSKINAQSGVSKSLEEGSAVTGSPAWDYTKMLKAQAMLKKLPELFQRVLELEKKEN